MAENKQGSKHSDNMVAGIVFVGLFAVLIFVALFSSNHPLDFIVNFLGTMVGYIFLIVAVFAVLGIFWYYWKMSAADPEQSLGEATKENLEYTKEVTQDLSEKAKSFYAGYKKRVQEAEETKDADPQ